ncbi:hypothetical protein OC846_005735 [Tilletia horrida]|uniref:MHD2 domain-containing protein n=1 Tax=Tilletia horrida TaxID=155126 RepID=A0AAN6JPM2_9BASI|nr:hypothetical protein OC846_005735 [Tilletia horrida]
MSVYIQHSLSRQVLESLVKAWDYKALHAPALASKPSNPAIPSPVSSGVGASSELTDSEIEEPILPLLDYLDECLKMLKWSLCDAEAQLVLKKVWKEVLRIIEDILVPPLGETLAIMRLLSDREVDIVFKWLHFLRSYFNARDEETGVEAGVPLEVLQGPKFREIISYSLFRHMGTDQLVTEIRRLVQQRDRAQLTAVGKSQMATRKVTVYSERNLETIRQHKREKVGKAEEAGELELLLRVLRMRSGADDYLPEMHRLVRSGAEGDIVAAEADVHQQPSTDHVQLPIPSQIRPSSHAKSKQKEPAQRIRPATIQELANAGEVVFNPATPIREVLMGAADLVTLAETYLNVKPEPDYQQAFICLTKAGRLLLDVLPNQHPGWKSELDLAARIKVKNDAEAVIDQLSKCRPILVDAFDRWKAQNPDLDINTVPTALTQQQQQQRKPLPPLPVQSGLAQSQAGKEPPSIQPAPFSSSSASHAAERRTATMHDTGQHRLPTHIPILARSLPVAHTPMFDTVREQEKPSTGEDDVKVRRTLYEGPSTTFETMSERPRPWRAETQESCGTSHEAEAAIMNGRLGCLLLSFPASAAFLLLVAMFSRSSSNWQGTQDPPRLGLVAFLLMVSLRSTFLVHLPLVHIVRVMMGSNSPAAKHLGGLIHHGRQVLLVADIVIVVVLALCHIDGTSWYHAAVRYVGLQRVNEGCNELGTPHTQPSLDQKFTPPAGPREDTPETKPARTATKGQRPSSLRIFVLFLVCQAAVILLHLVAYFEGHLTRLGPVQGRAAPSWQHFAFLLLLLAVSMDVSLFSHRQLTLSPVLTAIFGSRPFVTPLQDLVEHVRLVCLQVDLVAVLGLAFLFCTGGSWYEAAANHIGLETRTVVAAGATSSSPHVKANAPLSHSVTLAPTVADVGPTDGFESGPDSEEEAEVQGYLIENDASDQRHERPTDTAPATESINVDEGIPRDHDRKGKSRQAESAADQVASLLSKLKADPLALAERLSVRVTVRFDSEASARATGSRPSEQGQSSRIQDDQEPSI